MRIVHRFSVCFLFLLSVASAATLVGVNFGPSGSPSPTNWTLLTSAGTISNLVNTNGAPTTISLAVSGSPPPLGYSGLVPLAGSIPSDAPSFSNLQSNFYNNGGSLTAQFSGLTPNAYYDVYAIGLRFVGNLGETVTITGAGAPVAFIQNGAADSLFINGSPGSSSQTLESYAVSVQASGTGTITIQFAAGASSPSRYNAAGIALSASPVLAPTPVPSSMILTLIGLAGLSLYVLMRRARAARS